ncbi:hypothetical protein [Novosphingobium album (ex Liu et al. 2023)]|uniref:DUF2384 domain-containing protein n=1 Tax=Novosphingobium album (ex Liu et al. 2023) TaxID=3031130 RepID=A0ABT5WVH2_9SPHN|nr:hypothetical protein [Novosphingobium album (ex Liu et al. 2023)]MDE8653884.1 hypothetical protein [Novosphingobium album (ex Liu et al. 2023)]
MSYDPDRYFQPGAMTIPFPDTMTQAAFHEDMAARSGGLLTQAEVATLLGISPTAIDRLFEDQEILGVPYNNAIAYPAAQFANGSVISNLGILLRAFGDANPWEQIMMLTTPLEGFGPHPETLLQTLSRRDDRDTLRQLTGLIAGWTA